MSVMIATSALEKLNNKMQSVNAQYFSFPKRLCVISGKDGTTIIDDKTVIPINVKMLIEMNNLLYAGVSNINLDSPCPKFIVINGIAKDVIFFISKYAPKISFCKNSARTRIKKS